MELERNTAAGLQLIPINDKKVPTVTGWQSSDAVHDLRKAYGVGLVCGHLSGGVEAIDVDCKYDLTGRLFAELKQAIHAADKHLLQKLTVQLTRSGGYHLIYRCTEVQGNLKLARRPTTEEERKAPHDNTRVLIETRGEGGYIAVAPTPGYELIYGNLNSIQSITPAERETLLSVCRSFNELPEVFVAPKPAPQQPASREGLTPFDDYNRRCDVVSLLEQYGWTAVGQKGEKTLLRRPGETSATHSGNWDARRGWFTVFSSSTVFDTEKAYQPAAVYAILEHGGDFNTAAASLYAQGYGERIEKKTRTEPVQNPPETRAKPVLEELGFLANGEDYADYHRRLRDGTFTEYPGFGVSTLDPYLRLKDGDLYIINGIDNVGKSTVIWYLMCLAAVLHGWRFLVFSAENSVGGFTRKVMEFYLMKKLATFTDAEYAAAEAWMKAHFTVIRADEELYSLPEIISMAEATNAALGHHKGLLIDPYNALRLDVPQGSRNSTHEQHYEVITRLKLWGRAKGVACFVSTHAITEASRRVDEQGFIKAPLKGDVEGGGKFANKADQYLTFHRITQHPIDWMVTQLHLRKVKETETGGRVTPSDEPVLLRMQPDGCSFVEEDSMGRFRNPMQMAHGYAGREWE